MTTATHRRAAHLIGLRPTPYVYEADDMTHAVCCATCVWYKAEACTRHKTYTASRGHVLLSVRPDDVCNYHEPPTS